MKLFFLIISFLTISCASQAGKRVPAAGAQSSFGNNFSNSYQGPFEINPEGETRDTAKVYLPVQYKDKPKWPLVVLLHGFGGAAVAEDSYLTTRFRVSSRGFILVTPEGTKTPEGTVTPEGTDLSGKQFWNATDFCCDFAQTKVDDVTYLKNLITAVKAKYKVDSRKLYIFGHSNGGFMANRLACEMGEDIAGIANLAGGSFKEVTHCKNPQPIPYLQIHAVNDKTVSYNENDSYAGGKDTVAQWVTRNKCLGGSTDGDKKDYLPLVPAKETSQKIWKNCESGKPVNLWTIRSYSGTGHNPHVPLFKLNFTKEVLDFLLVNEL